MKVRGQSHAPASLLRGKSPVPIAQKGWVRPRANLNGYPKEKVSSFYKVSNSETSSQYRVALPATTIRQLIYFWFRGMKLWVSLKKLAQFTSFQVCGDCNWRYDVTWLFICKSLFIDFTHQKVTEALCSLSAAVCSCVTNRVCWLQGPYTGTTVNRNTVLY